MSQQIPTSTQDDLPVAEFNPRTGAPTSSKQKIVSAKPLEISDVKTFKGKWLKDKLTSLYNDPKFKDASPEQQKAYKSLAYEKWVSPYYTKVLKTNAPPKEDWLTRGGAHEITFLEKMRSFGTNLDKEVSLHTMKTTTNVTAGLLRNVADGLDYISTTMANTSPVAEVVRKSSQFVEKKGEEWQGRIEDQHRETHGGKDLSFKNDIPGRIAELGTQAIFFEATGAAKAAKLFNVANPKTAALALQIAKASWNGAVDFAAWSASQGEKPSEIGASAVSGAVLGGVLKTGQRAGLDPLFGLLKNSFKWGGKEATQQIISKAIQEAADRSEEYGSTDKSYRPSGWIHDIPAPHSSVFDPDFKPDSPLSEQSRKASTIAASELEKYSVSKFGRPFKELGYIQRAHVLNKLLAVTADAAKSASTEGMPKQIIQAQAKETDEMMAAIFPEAAASQKKVEEFVKQSGLEPQSTKLLASLPHHNTTIDSSWKHLQARASFLKSRLRTAKGAEREAILKAYNEEFALMKEKATREKATKSKGTVGGAAANDPKAFHGEQYVVTPNIDPYNTGFGDWRADSFAQGVAQMARQQAAAKGSARSFLTDAIDNSFMVGANLSKKAFLQEGTTKQLLHDQFGVVGGINYQMERAYNLGENSGFHPNDNLLFVNWLAMRPNVVARVWNVPGGGQTLFLHAAQEAERTGAGIALIPYDASRSFYEKMGMHDVGSYMAMTHTEVQNLLKNKGLLMMLLGAGITYGASKELSQGDYSVRGSN
jgi:hypothetical protein